MSDSKSDGMPDNTCQLWAPLTRESAILTSQDLLPKLVQGGAEAERSFLRLMPYLSRRLLAPEELVQAALVKYKPKQLETLLERLCRRTYGQGWLESRPLVWASWKRALVDERRGWEQNPGYQAALEANSGIEPFDFWIQQLKEKGHLSHQAAQGLASIWIFTLRLPWSLGVELFLRHSKDGSAAAALLTWRSVAGLQTGKPLLVTPGQLKRWCPEAVSQEPQLNLKARAIRGPKPPPARPLAPLPQTPSELLGDKYALLVTPEDLTPELGPLGELKPKMVLSCSAAEALGELAGDRVLAYQESNLQKACERISSHYDCPHLQLCLEDDGAGSLAAFCQQHDLENLLYYDPHMGPWKDHVSKMHTKDVGIRFFPLRRSWDAKLFPTADKGFVQFHKQAVSRILRAKGSL